MRKLVNLIWRGWLKIAFLIGNFITNVILIFFYFAVFGLFAVFYKLLSNNGFSSKNLKTTWVAKGKNLVELADFTDE